MALSALKLIFTPALIVNISGLCSTVSSQSRTFPYRGEVFDCDFNQMLKMQWRDGDRPLSLWDTDPGEVENREILIGAHYFGCTAGAGSSCGGALIGR